ncbi:MAG TPA: hypothetical protein VHD61_08895 [Lacunisphaera sp.]|nr:hypothetical protein [Lacunisphaera sp.]
MKLIIGMHRAGTSLTARLLKQAGADLGDPAGFIKPDRWNPDGYFEQEEILRLNRLLLHGPWGRFALLFPPTRGTVIARGRRLAGPLAAAGLRHAHQVVKDPRFCVTAPAWQEHGTRFEKVIICLRDPAEVAASLRRRNSLPRFLGLRLWRQHYADNLRLAQACPHWWVSYAHLVDPESCVGEVAGLARFLGLPFDEQRDGPWVRSVVRLRSGEQPAAATAYGPELARLWQEVCARHRAQSAGRGGD